MSEAFDEPLLAAARALVYAEETLGTESDDYREAEAALRAEAVRLELEGLREVYERNAIKPVAATPAPSTEEPE